MRGKKIKRKAATRKRKKVSSQKKADFHNMTIPVLGQPVKVVVKKLDGNDGLYHPKEKLIELSDSLKDHELCHCLFHELAHAVIDRLGIDWDNEQFEETIVHSMEMMFKETFDCDPLEVMRRFKDPS